MHKTRDDFIAAVEQSALLTPIQKREFLESPEILPEAYRERVIQMLRAYDERAKKRNTYINTYLNT